MSEHTTDPLMQAATDALLAGSRPDDVLAELTARMVDEVKLDDEIDGMIAELDADVPVVVSTRAQKVARAMITAGVAGELRESLPQGRVQRIVQLVHANLADEETLTALLTSTMRRARTVANTSLAGIQRNIAKDVATTMIGEDPQYYIYSGPAGDDILRPFCAQLVGKAVTLELLRTANNGQNLNPAVYLGGWNCRHTLVPTTLREIRQRGIEIATESAYCIPG